MIETNNKKWFYHLDIKLDIELHIFANRQIADKCSLKQMCKTSPNIYFLTQLLQFHT